MRTSIKINDQYIQKILLGSTPVQRIYQSGSIVYEAGGSTPCFEVVDTISEASGNYADVYAWDTEKWYKRNNLNQYEEYGIMEHTDDLSELTYYTGKLVILDTTNHEYKWNGSQWVDLGECEFTIHSPEYISRTSYYTGYVPLGDKFQENTVIEIDFQMTNDRGYAVIGDYWGNDNDDWRFFVNYSDGGYNGVNYDFDTTRIQTSVSNTRARFHLEIGNYYAKYYGSSSNLITGTRKTNFNRPNQMYLFHMDGPISQVNEDYGNVYMLKITQDGVLSKDFIPWTDMNGNYGFYDLVSNTVYPSTGNMTGSNNVTDIQISKPIEDYPTKVAPANNVHYDTLEELELMECPWIGMKATIGSNYIPYLYTVTGWMKQYTPCFEVVNAISQASGDYVDVYVKPESKWYKRNNLSQYEEYGVMPIVSDLSSMTYYTGKLVVLDTNKHEYKWNGTTWDDLGECEGDTILLLPDGYTQYPAIANNGNAYINSGYIPSSNTRILADMQITTSTTYGRLWGSGQWNFARSIQLDYENNTTGSIHGKWGTESTWNINSNVKGDFNRHVYDMYDHYLYRDGELVLTFASGTFTSLYNLAIFTYDNNGTPSSSEWINGRLYSFKIYDNGTLVRDFIPCKRDSDSKVGAYDIVNNVFYPSSSSNQFSTYGDPYDPLIPVEDYDTKVAPSDNVHYDTLEELELMECPWIGMTATIGQDYVVYVYTENGWVVEALQ